MASEPMMTWVVVGGRAMKPNEVVRFRCTDCQIVFDLRVDHEREIEVVEGPPIIEFGEPTCGPFCGAGELTPVHDRAILVEPVPSR
jgi:hypothetical protein